MHCKLFSAPICPPCLPDYPHKYGSEGGCADHSVFERMKKYQASAVDEPVKVSASITNNKALPPRSSSQLNTQMDKDHEIKNNLPHSYAKSRNVFIFSRGVHTFTLYNDY